jgi:hypothetical protein
VLTVTVAPDTGGTVITIEEEVMPDIWLQALSGSIILRTSRHDIDQWVEELARRAARPSP